MPERTLRSGWQRWRFDQMAVDVKDRIENPSEASSDRYVGLEHLDPGSLKIWRWGSTTDVEKTKFLFRHGDIIFGRRNAYLRRVAVADFDGVCSAHAMVLRARPEIVLPEFLPFFMLTETFWETALRNSAGSLSPTINWSNIATEEFGLPPLAEQRRIASVLGAANKVVRSFVVAEQSASLLLEAALHDAFDMGSATAPLSEWCRNLITYGIVQAGPDTPGGIPYIRVSDMTSNPRLRLDGMLRTSHEIASKYARSEVAEGDIVVALRGPVGLPRIVPPELDGANLTQGTARVSVRENHSRDYVFWALQAPQTTRQFGRYAKGSTFSEISLEALREVRIPVREKHHQEEIAGRLNKVRFTKESVAARVTGSQVVLDVLLRSLLEGIEG